MPDDAESQSSDIWREPSIVDDAERLERRHRIKQALFEISFGSAADRELGKPIPFREAPREYVEVLSPFSRAEYDAALSFAADPRNGDRIRV